MSWDEHDGRTLARSSRTRNGTYSYTLNNGYALVQGLDAGESLTETFNYTMQDADGDTDTATLTITITGTNDTPTVTVDQGNCWCQRPGVRGWSCDGLGCGANSEFASGTFTLSDADGLDDIVERHDQQQHVLIGEPAESTLGGCARHADGHRLQCGDRGCELQLPADQFDDGSCTNRAGDVHVSVSDGTTASAPASW